MEQVIIKSNDSDSPPLVTKEEWKEILSDEIFMSNNYKFALSIFYLEPNHKATCKFLAQKYNMSPFSLSGFITQFSSKVQEKLGKFEVITEDGLKSFWLITMTGKSVLGNLFEWKMRKELVEAITELDFINSNYLNIDNLSTLVNSINGDLSEFIKTFRKTRKFLSNKERATTSGILFKHKSDDTGWAINEGGHNEIQYHISLMDNKIDYGLGFNAQYVRFNNDKTSLELIKPFVEAFSSIQSSEEVKTLMERDFSIDLEALETMGEGGYNLFGRTIPLVDNNLPLVDYYSIINDLKGDLFNLYRKIFETTNEATLEAAPYNENLEAGVKNPLITEISELLQSNKNLILTGAPGTGKTYLAKEVCKALDATYELVQFHPSYDYTDFVEGLRPIQNENGEIGFELRDGIFKAFCKEALKTENDQTLSNFDEVYHKFTDDVSENGLQLVTPSHKKPFRVEINSQKSCKVIPDTVKQTEMAVTKQFIRTYLETDRVTDWKPYLIPICEYIKANYDLRLDSVVDKNKKFVIILDEINRAEISKVLGELFFSIDSGYRGQKGKVKTQYANLQTNEDVFKDGFYVPENVYIIGTMNDIDRSVESFDFAMRRRFAWREIKVEDRLSMWEGQIDDWAEEAKARLNSLNQAIEIIQGLNSAYHVGPAYFLKLTNYDGDFEALWAHHLQSLLFEYLRGYPDSEQQLKHLKDAYNMVDYDASND